MLPNKEQWMKDFQQSAKFNAIVAEVEQMHSKHNNIIVEFDERNDRIIDELDTPRYRTLKSRIIHLQPFYILDYISSMSEDVIYDIGCGYNFFKKFYNIIGIDPYDKHADINEGFDEKFAIKYQSSFANTFSINAIHFCNLLNLEKQIIGYFNLVKPGGYSYLAINMARVFDHTFAEYLGARAKILEKFYPHGAKIGINQMFEKLLDNNEYDVILYENLFEDISDAFLNGHIRILIKRK